MQIQGLSAVCEREIDGSERKEKFNPGRTTDGSPSAWCGSVGPGWWPVGVPSPDAFLRGRAEPQPRDGDKEGGVIGGRGDWSETLSSRMGNVVFFFLSLGNSSTNPYLLCMSSPRMGFLQPSPRAGWMGFPEGYRGNVGFDLSMGTRERASEMQESTLLRSPHDGYGNW